MNDNSPIVEELREIILWQQLNKQVIKMRDEGAAITPIHQKALQQFCFDSELFQKLTEDPLFEPIPLSLVTDFSGRSIVTFNNERWSRCISNLLEAALVLDIELALAGAFDVIGGYSNKFDLFDPRAAQDNADDDDALYEVIDQYNALLEKQGRNLPDMLNDLYEAKAAAIDTIMDVFGAGQNLEQESDLIFIDFSQSSKRDALAAAYRDQFCSKALGISHLVGATALMDMDLLGFLDDIENRKAITQSVIDFIKHERNIQLRQIDMLQSFAKEVRTWNYAKDAYRIALCKSSPFAFLQQPLPVV